MSQDGTKNMSKRKAKKAIPTAKRVPATAGLPAALNRQSKAELASVLLELAQANRGILRQLTAWFGGVA